MITRPLGSTDLNVTPIGFGSFKIGRNQNIKYPEAYDLPDEHSAAELLNAVLDLGVNYIDTAPAYGLSEERIGRAIGRRRAEYVLSTKVGETFANGESTYDFAQASVRTSIDRSRRLLESDVLDLVFIHSNGDDLRILNETDVVRTLIDLKTAGIVKAIGFSGKTVEGASASLSWADAIMVEYHIADTSHSEVMKEAQKRGVGIVVKKGLASGKLKPTDAIRFVLDNPAVSSLIIGGLNLRHMQSNLDAAEL